MSCRGMSDINRPCTVAQRRQAKIRVWPENNLPYQPIQLTLTALVSGIAFALAVPQCAMNYAEPVPSSSVIEMVPDETVTVSPDKTPSTPTRCTSSRGHPDKHTCRRISSSPGIRGEHRNSSTSCSAPAGTSSSALPADSYAPPPQPAAGAIGHIMPEQRSSGSGCGARGRTGIEEDGGGGARRARRQPPPPQSAARGGRVQGTI